MRKLLLSSVILLALSACNKEPTDRVAVPPNHDLTTTADSLSQTEEITSTETEVANPESISAIG